MFERWIVGIHVLGRAGHPGDATGTREKLDMQRIYTKAALLSLALFAGPGIFTATANPITSNAIVATSTLALAGSNDRREQQEAKRARKEARRVSRSSETVTKSARREQKSEAKHQRREERRQSEHVRREERRDAQHQRRLAESAAEQRANRHGRDRRHTSSRHSNSHNRHSSHRNSRHGSHHNSHHSSGIHIGIGGGDIHFGVHSSGTHRYRNRSYYESYRPPPTTYVEREIVVIEREVPVREAYVERPVYDYDVSAGRGWDYLIHGESRRAYVFFSELAQSRFNDARPKLGFGMSALAEGDIRNAAHGLRRAFEFDANAVSDGPGVIGFGDLVIDLSASVEAHIGRGSTGGAGGAVVTADHWFVSSALLFFKGDYDGASYSLESAKSLGDRSIGLVELETMIEAKRNYSLMNSGAAGSGSMYGTGS